MRKPWQDASLRGTGRMVGDLHVATAGTGPPLVLLHGNMESHRIFDAMVPLLAPHLTLIGIDSRGHGSSPRGGGALTIERMADDVAAVMTDLDLAGAPILGFSDGGNIALELALRHRDLPGPMVLVGSNLYPKGMTAPVWAAAEVAYRVLLVAQWIFPPARNAREKFELMARDPDIDPADLGSIRVPCLVVTGERDIIRLEHTHLVVSSLANARGAVVPGGRHELPTQKPAELSALVLDFLRESGGPGAGPPLAGAPG